MCCDTTNERIKKKEERDDKDKKHTVACNLAIAGDSRDSKITVALL